MISLQSGDRIGADLVFLERVLTSFVIQNFPLCS